MELIILDENSKNVVRGFYKNNHKLDPIFIADDFYILSKDLLLNDEIPPGIKAVLGKRLFFTKGEGSDFDLRYKKYLELVALETI